MVIESTIIAVIITVALLLVVPKKKLDMRPDLRRQV